MFYSLRDEKIMNWLMWLKPGGSAQDVCRACLACRERLFRLAYSWTGDAQLADDLVQATCEKALEKWQQVEDVAKLEQWACRMMRNLLHDHYRRQRPSEALDDHVNSVVDEDLEARLLRDDARRRVHEALQQLPLKLREVITLVDLECYTYQEVA